MHHVFNNRKNTVTLTDQLSHTLLSGYTACCTLYKQKPFIESYQGFTTEEYNVVI